MSAGRADTEAPASPGAERPFRDAGKLTPRQARFVDEYLIDLNATQAAIRAGYSPHRADSHGPRLLGNVGIAEAIEKAMAERSERTEITQDSVLRELALIGFADMAAFVQWSKDGVVLKCSENLSPEQTRLVAEVSQTKTEHGGTIKFKLHDKQAALVNLGRHLGLFTDHLKVNGLESLKHLSNEELIERIRSVATGIVDRAARARRGPGDAKSPIDATPKRGSV